MSQAAEVLVEETPSAALARVTRELAPDDARSLQDSLGAMFAKVEEWQGEARGLAVTSADQRGKMDRARSLRLEIKRARVDTDKRRKSLKSGLILKGKAIDGAFAIFESLSSPLETYLLEQESFAERADKARKDALRSARTEALAALGVSATAMPAALAEVSDEAWTVILDDAKLAKEAREEKVRQDERIRVEASRIAAEKAAADKIERERVEAERRVREEEQRAENERLKAEGAARELVVAEERRVAAEALRVQEEAAAAERERVEAERRAEQTKHDAELAAQRRAADEAAEAARRIQAELDAKREAEEATARAEAERVAREAAQNDKERLLNMAQSLRTAKLPEGLASARGQEIVKKVRERLEKLATDVEQALAKGVP